MQVRQPSYVGERAVTAVSKTYPFWLGGIANIISASITHPLDLTKVRIQVTGQRGMFRSITQTLHVYGGRGLYDGLTGTLARQLTYSMGRFAIYETTKSRIHTDTGPIPFYKMAFAGTVAGTIAGTLGNPFEIMMVRMQADRAKPLESRYNYRNPIHGIYRMIVDEGAGSLWRGVVPNALRAALMNMGQLASYDYSKRLLLNHFEEGIHVHVMASIAAGTIATTITSPPDVIKSRMMNAHGSTTMMQVIRNSLAKEGPMFMFKGWIPAWCRLQPTTMLIFLTLEQLKHGVDFYRASGGTLI
ncbi:uncharacterized protein L201_003660 [Kwoniella dendrophila CBS 6074]|uniref:Solute carrier family 25 (Mitochondrial dicarboxylate transporter), member 10 n=1 Tax=Kwoniella dendrophila CBS 6074 TaxID=1295534 RepID=A0AAX4JTR8_9TREE